MCGPSDSTRSRCMRWLLPLTMCVSLSSAATLSMSDQSAGPGQSVMLPVSFASGGDRVSGVQFDLAWDPGIAVQIAFGRDLAASGKLIYAGPIVNNSMRVLIIGMNQSLMTDGEIVRLFVSIDAAVSNPQIRLSKPLGVTPEGAEAQLSGSAATIRIDPQIAGSSLLPGGVLNSATLRSGPIAPGEIITLLGAFGIDPSSAGRIQSTINGVPATVLYAGGNQINATVPFALDF